MEIFVRNLPNDATEQEVRALFEPFGSVDTVTFLKASATERAIGTAFVSMPLEGQALSAINALRHVPLRGQRLEFNDTGNRFERRRNQDPDYHGGIDRRRDGGTH